MLKSKSVYYQIRRGHIYIMSFRVLKCLPKIATRWKVEPALFISIQSSSICFLPLAFVMSTRCSKYTTWAITSDTLNFGCHKAGSTGSTVCEPQMISNKGKYAASGLFRNPGLEMLFYISCLLMERILGGSCPASVWSMLTPSSSRHEVTVDPL